MKHLPLGLTVLLLGALPLAANAADYGPDCQPLAVSNSAQPVSATQTPAAPADALTKGGTVAASADEAPDISPLGSRVPPAASAPASSAQRSGPMSSSKPRDNTSTKPAVEPSPATWQSLLPGSIQ